MTARLAWLAAGLLGLLGFATRLLHGFEWDELQVLHGAWRIAHGAVPFRDFFEHHPPLLHGLLAPLVGRQVDISWPLLVALRSAAAIVLGGVLVALARLLGRRAGRDAAATVAVAIIVLSPQAGKLFELRADWIALLALLGAMLLLLGARRRSATLAGLLAGFAMCLTQKAVPLWLGMLTWAAVSPRIFASEPPAPRPGLLAFASASLVIPSIMLAWFWWNGAAQAFLESTVVGNLSWRREIGWETAWYASAVASLGAMALMLRSIAAEVRRLVRGPAIAGETSLVAFVAVFGMAAYLSTPVPWEQSFLLLVVPWMAWLAVDRIAIYAERPPGLTSDASMLAAALLAGALTLPLELAVRAGLVAVVAGAAIALASRADGYAQRFRGAAFVLLLPGAMLFVADRLDDVAGRRGIGQMALAHALATHAPEGAPVLALWDHVLPFRPTPAFHWFAHAGVVDRFRDRRGEESLDAEYARAVENGEAAVVIADQDTLGEFRRLARALNERCSLVAAGYAGSDGYACGWRETTPRVAPHVPAAAGAPNVIVVVIDTLRADHVSAYGYHRATTPTLDALAADGVLFEQAISQAPWTAASVGSLLTGLYPSVHGINGGVRWTGGGMPGGLPFVTQSVLRGSVSTLAETLQADGYRTAGFVSNVYLNRVFGFARGFDVYVDEHDDYSGDVMTRKRRAEDTNRQVMRWLDNGISEPFFLFVHYNDPHWPYDPPPPFGTEWTQEYRGRLTPADTAVVVESEGRPVRDLSSADLSYLQGLYDGEIRYADASLGSLLARVRSARLDRPILTVVTADHGEEFLEHGSTSHGYTLYDEQIRVPLVTHFPGHLRPSRVLAQVRLIDVMPTIRMLAGLPPKSVQGRSLIPVMEGQDSEAGRTAVSEAPLRGVMQALRTAGGWKLIRNPTRPTMELYDLRRDPAERLDRSSEGARVREALDRRLARRLASSARMARRLPADPQENGVIVDEALQRRLKALGYLSGDAPQGHRSAEQD